MGIAYNYKGVRGHKKPLPFLQNYKKTIYKTIKIVYNIIKEGDCDNGYTNF
jgi:hypothetical protein